MATWLPPIHETSAWSNSMKSGDAFDCTSAAMSDSINPKLFLRSSRQFTSADDSSSEAYESAAFNLSSATDTKPGDYSVTTSTTVATTARGGSKSSTLLGASAGAGGASTKVSKKRARASRKPPTTVLEADSSNFRAMVQQLTGIPSLPFLPPTLQQQPGLEFLDLVRPPPKSLLGFGAPNLPGLPHMDPSSLMLNREPAFSSPYFKYMSSQDQSRRPPSMGDFLRTPLDELGLDQKQVLNTSDHDQEQQQQRISTKLEPAMPLLWEGTENPRESSINDMSKYKSSSRPEAGAQTDGGAEAPSNPEGSRMAHIVDSWLSQTDPGTDNTRTDNLL